MGKKRNNPSMQLHKEVNFFILLYTFAFQLQFDLLGLLLKIVTNEKLKQLDPICIKTTSLWKHEA